MKHPKKICALITAFAVSFQIFSLPVHASSAAADCNEVICAFSDSSFLIAAEAADRNGIIDVKGENKIVPVNENLYDYYINNVLWSGITILGAAAAGGTIGAVISAVPGISATAARTAASVVGSLAGGVGGTLLSARRGVIIRVRLIDISCGVGTPRYNYEFISIQEQK